MFLGLMLAFAGETIFGIVADRVSDKVTDAAVAAVTKRLGRGRLELPENHDLERAHRTSARFAFQYLIAQTLPSVEGDPSKARARFSKLILARPPATAGFGAAEPGSLLAWCRELEALLESDSWIDGWGADALERDAVETVASARIDEDLLADFHADALRALAASSLSPVPDAIADAVRNGWPVIDPANGRESVVTLYGAYCLRFQDLIAHDTVLARKVEMNSRAVFADRLTGAEPTASIDPAVIAGAVRAEVGAASDLLVDHLVGIAEGIDGVSTQLDGLTAMLTEVRDTTARTEVAVGDLGRSMEASREILRRLDVWVSTTPAVRGVDTETRDVDVLLAEYAVHLREQTGRMLHGGGEIAITRAGVEAMPLVRRGPDAKGKPPTALADLGADESIVLTGGPGTGKSTILQWLVHRELDDQRGVPVSVTCRTLRDGVLDAPHPRLVRALVEHAVGARGDLADREVDALSTRLVDDVASGRALLALDGLDEISDGGRRTEFAARLAAALAPGMRVVVTTRDSGAEGAVAALAERFERLAGGAGLGVRPSQHYEIGALDAAAQRALIDAWAAAGTDDAHVYARLRAAVDAGSEPARLGRTVLVLSLLAQEVRADERLPVRRRDLFRRIVERSVGRQRPIDPPLTVDEVFPRLEHVALTMIRRGDVEAPEIDVVGMLRAFDATALEDYPTVVPRRSPTAFLDAVVSTGLLVAAGAGPRRRGIPQRMISFFHQSFQAYFAGRALVHRWAENGAAVDDLRRVLDTAAESDELQPQWIETLRHAVDAAEAESLDARWFGAAPTVEVADLLSLFLDPPRSRSDALDVLGVGLAGLAATSELTVPGSLADRVLAAAVSALDGARRPAAWTEAIGDLLASPWRSAVIAHYGSAGSRAAREWGAGIAEHILPPTFVLDDLPALLSARLQRAWASPAASEGAVALFEVVEIAFRARGPLADAEPGGDEIPPSGVVGLAADHKATVWDALIALEAAGADPRLVAWALVWMSAAREPVGDVEGLTPAHRAWADDRLRAFVADPTGDPGVVADVAMLAALPWNGTSAFAQLDWLYQWAVVADGGVPHSAMPSLRGGVDEPLATLLTRLVDLVPAWAARWVAIAAARAGARTDALVEPLWELFTDDREWHVLRDEAWFSLLGVGGERVASRLRDAISDADEFLQLRGAIGTIALGCVDDLVELAEPGPHYDDAYVFALLGNADPRGATIVFEAAQSHASPEHRERVLSVLQRAAESWTDDAA